MEVCLIVCISQKKIQNNFYNLLNIEISQIFCKIGVHGLNFSKKLTNQIC